MFQAGVQSMLLSASYALAGRRLSRLGDHVHAREMNSRWPGALSLRFLLAHRRRGRQRFISGRRLELHDAHLIEQWRKECSVEGANVRWLERFWHGTPSCVQASSCATHVVPQDAQRSAQEREALHLIGWGRYRNRECASTIGRVHRSGSRRLSAATPFASIIRLVCASCMV
jgi:hypothetical protein